jgi:tight adherence protein B
MDPLALAAALAVMAAIVALLVAVYQMTASPRDLLERRLESVIGDTGTFEDAYAREALRPKRIGRVPVISALLEGRSWTEATADALERADLQLTVSEYVALRALAALALSAVALIAVGGGPAGIGVAVVAAATGFLAPAFYLKFAQSRRAATLEKQLIEALSMISNSLKAGFGLTQALDLASKQMDHPLATEFRRVLYDVNVGSSMDSALKGFGRRSNSSDVDIVVTAILIQQSTGGNLSEILDNVAHTMRERVRIRGEIKTLTAQQMLTGFIIGGLPIVMAGAFTLLSPGYMQPLLTEATGRIMLIGAGLLELFGVLIIRRILAIEV